GELELEEIEPGKHGSRSRIDERLQHVLHLLERHRTRALAPGRVRNVRSGKQRPRTGTQRPVNPLPARAGRSPRPGMGQPDPDTTVADTMDVVDDHTPGLELTVAIQPGRPWRDPPIRQDGDRLGEDEPGA